MMRLTDHTCLIRILCYFPTHRAKIFMVSGCSISENGTDLNEKGTAHMKNLRYCAIPLLTIDPFFSIWSMSDHLYDDVTKHWTGRRNPISAGVYLDGEFYSLMGQRVHNSDRQSAPYRLMANIPQTSVKVTPTATYYTFENDVIRAKLSFLSPLVLDRLDLLSRPVSYMEYALEVIDGKEHSVEFYFDMSTECSVDTYDGKVICRKGKSSVYFGKSEQAPLSKVGDSVCIDWGYIHISEPSAQLINGTSKSWEPAELLSFDEEYEVFREYPYVCVRKNERSGVITFGYDDIYSVEYFGEKLEGYYKKYYGSFDEMFEASINEYGRIKQLCAEFDARVLNDARKVSDHYAEIVSLAYRQSVAAHKLVCDSEGHDLFLSKECHSNGCMGTLDCTYESSPLFYKYNPDLMFAMIRPIARFACSDKWPFDFVPHDVGRYPVANGQVYGAVNGEQNPNMQMPLEECGNLLLCALSAVKYGAKDRSFIEEYRELLKKTADYLVENGFDPALQLCTDDFTGKFAHSCNLSIKAILGIACYGVLYGDEHYTAIAKEYAGKWEALSVGSYGSSRLAFDLEDSWSLKYNIIWDKLLELNVFRPEVFEREVAVYREKLNPYGIPLDMRQDYTINIWNFWTTVMTDDKEYLNKVIDAEYAFINDTLDRVPITDWHCTSINRRMDFQNRSVVGGLFVNMLVEG